MVHGDDFTSLGIDENLDWLVERLRIVYEYKHRCTLGADAGDLNEARLLNRRVTWGQNYIDQRSVEITIAELGLGEPKSFSTPGVKEKECDENDDKELNREDARNDRRVAARLNFLAMERPDLQYSAK